jgi:hypothetical protein
MVTGVPPEPVRNQRTAAPDIEPDGATAGGAIQHRAVRRDSLAVASGREDWVGVMTVAW